MSETVFKQVNYDLNALVNFIELGFIGLPDIQRPFVWSNAKVRDLFDSMYRGYPVGYLLFWQNALSTDSRPIGVGAKQQIPSLLIVDGQQRLTSIYAVVRKVPVIRDLYSHELIDIAFNPLSEQFEVADAAIRRDKSFIPDISRLWHKQGGLFPVVESYISGLKESRELSTEDITKIQNNISKLYSLLSFPLTALELSANVSEEDVSEVFVRINSKGTPLNQADFILTLMSVFWDEGRTQLEDFCRDARQPAPDRTSSYNVYIQPSPDQLLRVSVGLGFKRARLKYIYSILRGKDLETEQFSDERRIEQFEVLKKAQQRVVNLQYWQDFLLCIRMAGYCHSGMISSQTSLIYSYVFYLIGRTEFQVEEHLLRKTIAKWFFFSSLTGRFTGSPESAMEFDLARLRGISSGDEFIQILNNVCDTALTDDYWTISLPNELATSSSRSPSLFAYTASLVLLDARALFSSLPVAWLVDPLSQGKNAGIERHHLFPKGYLKTLGITDLRDVNQIANYALIEWGDNRDFSDNAPADYLPVVKSKFSKVELDRMYYWHALPEHWESLDYQLFLQLRRSKIAQVIKDGYLTLLNGKSDIQHKEVIDLDTILATGESSMVEFKSTLRVNLHTKMPDPKIENAVLRTIAGFLNLEGGVLTIGIADDLTPIGIGVDGFENEDKMSLHLVNLLKDRIGPLVMPYIHIRFEDYDGTRVMVIQCNRSDVPAYVTDGQVQHFYLRTGPSTTELNLSQTHDYVNRRFKH